MRSIKTPSCNIVLKLPGGTDLNDLHATRIHAYDPNLGETEADAHPAFESEWALEPEERRRLAAGATLTFVCHGDGHPPVSFTVGAPGENARAELLDADHVNRALAALFVHFCDGDGMMHVTGGTHQLAVTGEGFLKAWESCLAAARDTPAHDEQPPIADQVAEVRKAVDRPEPDPEATAREQARHREQIREERRRRVDGRR